MKERRGFFRAKTHHLSAETVIQFSIEGRASHQKIEATIEDLSGEGFLLRTAEKLLLNACIIVNIPLPDDQFVCCKAVVVRRHVHDHRNLYGCHCSYLTDQDRDKIERFVYTINSGSSC